MIGQMIMVGLSGPDLSLEEKRLFQDYSFGGVILFNHNLQEPKQIVSLCRSLWEAGQDLPPFIAVDHEGGRVHRLPPPFTHFSPMAALGRNGNPSLAYNVGLAMGRELSAIGINVNLAPVLDVHSNPNNPVIKDRSLSSDPDAVIALGWPIIQGLRDGGIIPCGKHFPGHGDTEEDSHFELPVVRKDKASLRAVELPPFIYACRNHIESLMTAHVLYPSLDPKYPATLSRPIVTDLLRRDLGYEGVVFGDDMEMKAISKNYSLEETVALSINAGVDVLMFSHQKEAAVKAYEFLRQETEETGPLKRRAEESFQRIKRLKQSYLTSFTAVPEHRLKEAIGIPRRQRITEEIQKAAATLVRKHV